MQFVEILSRFAGVSEQDDGGYIAHCPAHSDSKPSLRIWRGDDNKVRFTCRAGCANGDVVNAAGLRWQDLFDVEGEGNTVPKEPPAPVGTGDLAALAHFVDLTQAALFDFGNPYANDARKYAAGRFGLTEDAMADLELGYASSAMTFKYASRVFTQYRRLTVPLKGFDGMPRGLQGRDLTGECPARWVSLSNPQGYRWAPYGVFRGHGGYNVWVITEGPGDGLSAVSLGYDAVVVRGASLVNNPELIEELAHGVQGRLVIVAGDNDEAGGRFNRAVSEGLGTHGIAVYALGIPRGDRKSVV